VVRGGTLNAAPSTAEQREQAAIGVVLSQENPVRGVRVSQIYPGSPADEAGVRSGDLIMAVDGKRVTSPEELRSVILQHRPGDELDLSVNRQGWRRNFLLISMEQSDLAKLPAPQVEKPTGVAAPAPTAPAVPAPPVVRPYPSEATPGHTFGEVGGPDAQPPQNDAAPRDSWGNTYNVNRRALYTDFD
jgi:membrane-associated protease RseP (regulator of RpoE activity)